MDNSTTDGGRWGQNTALWAIVAIIIVIAFLWWCHKSGDNKAALAESIQRLYGRVDCLAPQLEKYTERTDAIAVGLAKSAEAQKAFQKTAYAQLADLDDAVFTSRCGGGCGCNSGNGRNKFEKRSTYTLDSTEVTEIDTCVSC